MYVGNTMDEAIQSDWSGPLHAPPFDRDTLLATTVLTRWHDDPNDGLDIIGLYCVAHGGLYSEAPPTLPPAVIALFGLTNDALDAVERQVLKQFLPALLAWPNATWQASPTFWLVLDWVARKALPLALDAVGERPAATWLQEHLHAMQDPTEARTNAILLGAQHAVRPATTETYWWWETLRLVLGQVEHYKDAPYAVALQTLWTILPALMQALPAAERGEMLVQLCARLSRFSPEPPPVLRGRYLSVAHPSPIQEA